MGGRISIKTVALPEHSHPVCPNLSAHKTQTFIFAAREYLVVFAKKMREEMWSDFLANLTTTISNSVVYPPIVDPGIQSTALFCGY